MVLYHHLFSAEKEEFGFLILFLSFHIRFLGQDSKQEIYLHINDKMVIMLTLGK